MTAPDPATTAAFKAMHDAIGHLRTSQLHGVICAVVAAVRPVIEAEVREAAAARIEAMSLYSNGLRISAGELRQLILADLLDGAS